MPGTSGKGGTYHNSSTLSLTTVSVESCWEVDDGHNLCLRVKWLWVTGRRGCGSSNQTWHGDGMLATSGGWMYWHPAGKLYEIEDHFSYRNVVLHTLDKLHSGCWMFRKLSQLGAWQLTVTIRQCHLASTGLCCSCWLLVKFSFHLRMFEYMWIVCTAVKASKHVCEGFCTHHASSSLAAIKLVSATQGHLRPDVLSAFLHLLRHSCVRVIGHMLDPLASNPMHNLALTIMSVLNVHESNTAFRNLRQT